MTRADDITESGQVEQALGEHEELVELLMNSTAEGIYGLDLEGNCTFCNRACVDLLGYENSEQFLGKNMHDLIHHTRADGKPYPEEECKIFLAFRESEQSHETGEVLWRSDGTSFAAEYWSYPVRRAGELIGSVVAFVDISERKQAESVLAERSLVALLGAEVSAALTSPNSIPASLQGCAEAIVKHVGAAFARIWLLEDAEQMLELVASAGLYTHLDGAHSRIPLGHFKIGRIAKDRQPQSTNAVIGDPHVPEQAWAKQEGIVAFAGYPLVVADDVIGVMGMFATHPLTDYILDGLGSIAGTIALGTLRKRAEEKLLNRTAELEAVLNAIPDLFFWVDADGTIQDHRSGGSVNLFVPPEAFLGKPVQTVLPDGVGSRVQEAIRQALRSQSLTSVDYALPTVDGEDFYEARIVPLDERQVLAIARDVTAQKRAERAREESEAHYRTLVEHAPEAIMVLDMERNRFVDMNEKACALFKRSREELLEIGPMDVSPPVQPDGRSSEEGAREMLQQAIDGGTPRFEWIHLDSAGKEIPCEVSLVRLPSETRVLVRGSMTDISERKHLEEDRQNLEARIQQSQRLDSLGVMAGGIAHDFNNLLTGMMAHASFALDDLDPQSQARECIEEILRGSEQAAELTRQMLAFSGKATRESRAIDLSESVRAIFHLLSASISKRINLRLELEEKLPAISGDPSQIQQLVMNLVINGAEACGDNAGSVVVKTGLTHLSGNPDERSTILGETQAGEYVWLEVKDDGCGMDEATRARIFDPFFTTKFTGRGLGLSALLGIVHGHKGAVKVESVLGEGACFTVFLPASGVAVESAAREQDEADLSGEGLILVVDDEPLITRLAQRILTRHGYRVITAKNGKEAVDIFKERALEVDAVLLDMTMPEMDGHETFQAIRALRPDVVAVLSSGYDETEATMHFKREGLAGFIQKPYRAKALASMIKTVLQK